MTESSVGFIMDMLQAQPKYKLSSTLSVVSDISEDDDISLLSSTIDISKKDITPLANTEHEEDLLDLSSFCVNNKNTTMQGSYSVSKAQHSAQTSFPLPLHHLFDNFPINIAQSSPQRKRHDLTQGKSEDSFPPKTVFHCRKANSISTTSECGTRIKLRDRSCHSISTTASSKTPCDIYIAGDSIADSINGTFIRTTRGRSSSTSLSISTMENIDDKGWDKHKRREFFDQQRQKNMKSKIKQEMAYYMSKMAPFHSQRAKPKQVDLKQSDGYLA